MKALEELNEQLRARKEQLEAMCYHNNDTHNIVCCFPIMNTDIIVIVQNKEDVSRLRKGTVDVESERELMREVIVQQSESLLRKVEDLSEERKTAEDDRKQLLGLAADLCERVESAESRIAQHQELEKSCVDLEAAVKTLGADAERKRRTNDALCQQALGEEGDGPLAGVLAKSLSRAGAGAGALNEDARRLVQGQLLVTSQGDSLQADAQALCLKIQQQLAQREEAFWVERQGLSDRVMALERARGGRTGALLRAYDTAAKGGAQAGSAGGGGGVTAGAAGAAAAVKERFRGLLGT